jgi:hypothetical protein
MAERRVVGPDPGRWDRCRGRGVLGMRALPTAVARIGSTAVRRRAKSPFSSSGALQAASPGVRVLARSSQPDWLDSLIPGRAVAVVLLGELPEVQQLPPGHDQVPH